MTNAPMMPPVGTVVRRSRTLTWSDIDRFTEITGDHNPLHYDESLASASRFGGIIVQGGVTSGLFNAIVAEDLPGPGTVFLQVNWSFRAPGRPGDTITAEVEVLERRDDKPIATLRTTLTNQHGETLIDGSAVVYRDPSIALASADQSSGTPSGQQPQPGRPRSADRQRQIPPTTNATTEKQITQNTSTKEQPCPPHQRPARSSATE